METRSWTYDENLKLYNLVEKLGADWENIQHEFPNRSKDSVRKHYNRYLKDDADRINKLHSNPIENAKSKRKHRYLSNGGEESELVVTEEALQTRESLMIAHDYNPHEFEMIDSTSNYWDMPDAEKSVKTLFQSKVRVKPRKQYIDWDKLGNELAKRIKPNQPTKYVPKTSENYLVIPLFDLHFGNNELDDYDSTLDKIFNQLENEYKEILIMSGGDLLHVDNHKSTTANGTQLDTTDLTQAWEDAFDFLDLIIDKSLNSAETVNLMYVPGNHDESSAQTIMKALERLYQKEHRLHIDSSQQMYKATLLGHNFIGATHGIKKNKKDYPILFATQFSKSWGTGGVMTREVYTGHLHHELVQDMNGLLIRQMPTRNKTDKWHRDNGFVGSHKRFQLVEYSKYETEMIRYV